MSKKAQLRALPKVCPYCCKLGVSSKDHIPPRVFLLAPAKQEQQDQFITIKCCTKCNEGFSELDTLFAEFVSIWLGVNNPSWQRLWDENVFPTILGNHRRHTELIQSMQDIDFPTPSGGQERRTLVTLDADIPRRMCARLLRGLYFREFNKPLPIDVDIASELYRDLEGFSEILAELPKKNIGRQFTYWVIQDETSPFDTMWFFDFHGGLCAMAGSGARSSIITKDPDMTICGTAINRAQTYRRAGRTLRYSVYVAMEWAWAVIALYAVGRDLFLTPDDAAIAALGFLIALSLAHSTTMTFVQPWQLLKAILAGVIAFGAALGLVSLSGAPFDPIVPAIVIGSAYYLWLGELWTRRVAIMNEEQ